MTEHEYCDSCGDCVACEGYGHDCPKHNNCRWRCDCSKEDPVDVNTEYARQYIESALRESMNNYIGQPASKVSADTIKNVLEGQLNEMNKQGLFKEKKAPTVEVTINGPYVETRFYDPDTGEEVGLYDPIS